MRTHVQKNKHTVSVAVSQGMELRHCFPIQCSVSGLTMCSFCFFEIYTPSGPTFFLFSLFPYIYFLFHSMIFHSHSFCNSVSQYVYVRRKCYSQNKYIYTICIHDANRTNTHDALSHLAELTFVVL